MKPYRMGAAALGIACGGLGMWGAYEFAHKLEGGAITYLVLAAPVVALAAATIPPIAEATWREAQRVKALLWWLALLPAAAVVFYSAAERVHFAKAGSAAERKAYQAQADRHLAALVKAETEFKTAQAAANRARALPARQCGVECRTALEAERTAKAAVDAAKADLLKAERLTTAESPLQAPVWLLPLALDVVGFLAIWTALSGGQAKAAEVLPAKDKRKAKRRKAQARKPTAFKPRLVANDNA